MLKKIQFYISVLFIPGLFLNGESTAREYFRMPDDPEENAIAFFKEGKYARALPVFEDLVNLYPKDKKLNYYLGACLIETKNYGLRARQALLTSVGKEQPGKINYYLGIAFHAENDFLTALDYYHRFEKEATIRSRKSVDYEKYIDLCEQGINPFITERKAPLGIEPLKQDTGIIEKSEPLPEILDSVKAEVAFAIPESLFDSIIVFQVNPEIRYMKMSQFKESDARISFVKGWLKKQELDSLVAVTDKLREKYEQSVSEEKDTLAIQIIGNEQQILHLNREIPGYDLNAQQIEAGYWEKHSSSEEIEKLLAENNAITDSMEQLHLDKQKAIITLPPEKVVIPDIGRTVQAEEETADKGIVYKIQIGAFRKRPPDWINRLYKKLSLIRKISNYTDENGVTVYTVGEMRSYQDAVEMQKQVKLEGVPKPIIAAYKDGKRINVNEARKINGE